MSLSGFGRHERASVPSEEFAVAETLPLCHSDSEALAWTLEQLKVSLANTLRSSPNLWVVFKGYVEGRYLDCELPVFSDVPKVCPIQIRRHS